MATSVQRRLAGQATAASLVALALAVLCTGRVYAANANPGTLLQQDTPLQDAQLAQDLVTDLPADPIHPWDNNDLTDTVSNAPGVHRHRSKSVADTTPIQLSDNHLVTKSAAPSARPEQIGYLRNLPNPFNAQTKIEFALEQPGAATLEVYNLLGQVQARVEWRHLEAGTHSWLWNGNSQNGRTVPSGVYFYRLEVNQTSAIGRMVLLK